MTTPVNLRADAPWYTAYIQADGVIHHLAPTHRSEQAALAHCRKASRHARVMGLRIQGYGYNAHATRAYPAHGVRVSL